MDAGRFGSAILPALDLIREADPVFWSEQSQCWFITRNEDIIAGFSGDLPLSSDRIRTFALSTIPQQEQEARIPNLLRYATHMSVDIDPPEHTRVRKLLTKAFSRKVVEDIRPFVQQYISSLLDGVVQDGGSVEFMECVARKLPASVILRLLGLPDSYLVHMKYWANAFIGALASSRPPVELIDEAERATAHMAEVAKTELGQRHSVPQADLLTALLKAHEEDDRLTEQELIAAIMLVIVAGHDTTTNSMTLIVMALSQHPEAWEYMHAHPDRMPACADELMRYIAMAFVQPRVATEDFSWHGKQIKKGQIVMLMQGTGNRDPRVFEAPDTLDFERRNDKVLTFGPGLHHCLGHQLAKMQISEFLKALVQRFKAVTILDQQLDHMPQIAFRGLYSLNVKFTGR